MSAQFDPYHVQLLKDAFCFKEETLEFQNFATLLSGIPTEDFEKDGAVSLDLDELLDLLCDKVTNTFEQHPHIVFMAKDNESLRYRLKKICDDRRKPYVYILKEGDAIAERVKHNNTNHGVLVIDESYANGYDIRLGKDAFVHILGNCKTLMPAVAKQMAGRGTRMQGVPKAFLYLIADPTIRKNPWELLEANDQ